MISDELWKTKQNDDDVSLPIRNSSKFLTFTILEFPIVDKRLNYDVTRLTGTANSGHAEIGYVAFLLF